MEFVQAVSQQTPSEQFPDEHCAAAEHVCPFGFFPHEPSPHVLGVTQSASDEHELLQLPLLHTNVPQDALPGVTHDPDPSHFEAGVTELLVAHTEPLQFIPLA